MIDYVQAHVKKLDILINNAGVSQRSKTEDTEMEVYRSLMEVNYFAVVKLTKTVMHDMLKRGEGSIVTISSIAGKVGPPYRSGYSASKHAVVGMTKTAALEYAHMGIRVNAVCPGFTKTSMLNNENITEEYKAKLKYATPMGRFGETKEIADAIIYLASAASSFMTGQSVILDGGLSVQ